MNLYNNIILNAINIAYYIVILLFFKINMIFLSRIKKLLNKRGKENYYNRELSNI